MPPAETLALSTAWTDNSLPRHGHAHPPHYMDVDPIAASQVQQYCHSRYQRFHRTKKERCEWVMDAVGVTCTEALHRDTITLLSAQTVHFVTAYIEDALEGQRPIGVVYNLTSQQQVEQECTAFSTFVKDHFYDTLWDLFNKGEVTEQTYNQWMAGHSTPPHVFDAMTGVEAYLELFRPSSGTDISYLAFYAMCTGQCQEVLGRATEEMEAEAVGDGYESDEVDC